MTDHSSFLDADLSDSVGFGPLGAFDDAEDAAEETPEVYVSTPHPIEEAPAVCWLATEDGAAYVEADAPLARLTDLLHEDARYASVYDRLLALCAREEGAAVAEPNNAVGNDELLQNPRLYAPHFIDKLERCDALEWRDKAWRYTAAKVWTRCPAGRSRRITSRLSWSSWRRSATAS